MTLRTLPCAILAFQFLRLSPCGLGPQKPDDLSLKLSKQVTSYSLGKSNFIEALIRVSTDSQVPMGITWVDSPTALAQIPFEWKDATIQEIIESIAKTQSGYEVQIGNGVVHIFAPGTIPDRQNFLKVKIGNFEVHDEVEVASWKLHMLITPRMYAAFSIGATGDSRVDMELKDTTVEGVLDALAATSKRQIWIVTFSNDTRLTHRGLRRTISLWNEKPVPDEDQPVWDLLRWGNPLPPLVSGAPPS